MCWATKCAADHVDLKHSPSHTHPANRFALNASYSKILTTWSLPAHHKVAQTLDSKVSHLVRCNGLSHLLRVSTWEKLMTNLPGPFCHFWHLAQGESLSRASSGDRCSSPDGLVHWSQEALAERFRLQNLKNSSCFSTPSICRLQWLNHRRRCWTGKLHYFLACNYKRLKTRVH